MSFASDTDTGLYRIGANNLGVAVAGAKAIDIAGTAIGIVNSGSATVVGLSMYAASLTSGNELDLAVGIASSTDNSMYLRWHHNTTAASRYGALGLTGHAGSIRIYQTDNITLGNNSIAPSAWGSTYRGLQMGYGAIMYRPDALWAMGMMYNGYYNGSVYKQIAANTYGPSMIQLVDGFVDFYGHPTNLGADGTWTPALAWRMNASSTQANLFGRGTNKGGIQSYALTCVSTNAWTTFPIQPWNGNGNATVMCITNGDRSGLYLLGLGGSSTEMTVFLTGGGMYGVGGAVSTTFEWKLRWNGYSLEYSAGSWFYGSGFSISFFGAAGNN